VSRVTPASSAIADTVVAAGRADPLVLTVLAGPPDPALLEPLAVSYGLFFDPTWVPELVEKYGLIPPFA
jgi:hypothetical protein